MLSVLATLCVGCQTDLIFSGALASYTSHDAETVQTLVPFQPVLIAGPYDLNPGLYRSTQPGRLKPHAEGRQQLPLSPPALPTVTPISPPAQGPKGGVASPPIAQESYTVQQESLSQPAYFPALPTSPLLFISPAARPSGPTPRPSGPAPQLSGGPAPRPSGPAPQPSGSAPRPSQPIATSDSPQPRPEVSPGDLATPIKRTSTYSPAVRTSGPRLLLPRVPEAPKSPIWTKSHQRSSPTSSSVEQAVPRLRSLPAPPYPQNISPTSQPGLVKSDPSSIPTPAQPLVTPADISTQKPKSGPPKRLPTDIAPLGAIDDPKRSFIVLESFTTDFNLDFDEFGKENLEIGEIVSFRIRNGDQVTFTTGLNTYRQDNIESVKNIPLILGWETQAGDVTVNVAAGAEVFNRLDPQPTFKVGAKTSLFGEVLVSGEVEHGPYKFNATTLENEISYWRIRPGVFWQIDSKTSFLGLFQAGFFNDGNQEIQSFSRLERKIGPFSVAANLFTWNVAEDLEAQSGYFSPLSFLNYNAEIGWKGRIFDPLSCQFAASIGNQVLNGSKSTGRGLQAKCTASLADNINLDFGYALTNILSSGSGASNSHIFTGQFQIDF